MAKIEPHAGRVQIKENIRGCEIVIPAKSSPFVVLFLLAWLGGWAVGMVSVTGKLSGPAESAGSVIFLLVWLAGWTAGGVGAMLAVTWFMVGREIVSVDDSELRYVRTYGLFSRKQEYNAASVKLLRVSPQHSYDGAHMSGFPGWSNTGMIAFDYGAATPRFGADIEEAEARKIVETLLKRFPKLADA
ncbi:MAG TPA: hypothetical protein VJL90_13555 [Pseudorhodoplanes sp.]|nr:hypothetical protein [Pseudorhodoplanes sp.]